MLKCKGSARKAKGGRGKSGKTSKSKVTKTKRMQSTQNGAEHVIKLRAAIFTEGGEDKDVLAPLAAFSAFKIGEQDVTVEFATGKTVDHTTRSAEFYMCKQHLEECYNSSGWGWDDDDKKGELRGEATRHLIARCGSENEMIGFAAFRFTLQGELFEQVKGNTTLLVYDLHVKPEYQRSGLGRHLMRLLEMIALKQHMSFVEIFVTRDCEPAHQFVQSKLKGYSTAAVQALMDDLEGDVDDESFTVYSKCVDRQLKARRKAEAESKNEAQALAWSLSKALTDGLAITSAATESNTAAATATAETKSDEKQES